MPACLADQKYADLFARHKRVDLDGMGALNRNGIEFVVIDLDVGILGVSKAASPGVALDYLASDFINQKLTQPVAASHVNLAKRYPLGRGSGRIEGDLT
jgi:hypothetical protein